MSIERPSESVEALVPESPLLPCWRCGKPLAAAAARCPWCSALVGVADAQVCAPRASLDSALMRVLAATGLMLLMSIVQVLVLGAMASHHGRSATVEAVLPPLVVMEALDTLLVILAFRWVRERFPAERKSLARRLAACLAFLPILAGLLAMNVGYHRLLLGAGYLDVLQLAPPASRGAAWALFAAVCVQPAVVEELLYRYLVLGVLRGLTGKHAAVLISSIMFGMAHLGAPLSIPMLTVVGVVFAYARVSSGTMALPMALHLLHNAAILWLEGTLFAV